LSYIQDQSGKFFDPEVVDAFLAIYDVITAIRDRYQEVAMHPGQETSPEPTGAAPPAQKS
jgi:hypothetical protein